MNTTLQNKLAKLRARSEEQLTQPETPETNIDEGYVQPETSEVQTQPTQPEAPETDIDEGNLQPETSETSPEVDYKNKYERLQSKAQKNEKELAALRQEQANAKAVEAYLAKTQPAQTVPEETPSKTMEETYGDNWKHLDPDVQEVLRQISTNQPKPRSDAEIDELVSKRMRERDSQDKLSHFTNSMDQYTKSIDPDTTFMQVVNEPKFEAFIRGSQRRKALYEVAASTQDSESETIMKELMGEYLGVNAETPKSKKSPSVTNTKTKVAPKKDVISEAEYSKARTLAITGPDKVKHIRIVRRYLEQNTTR